MIPIAIRHSELMYNAPILKKAVEIIKLIVKEQKPLGVTDIARSLAISKSTTFGILKSLEEEGFLVKDPFSKKYSTGNTLFESVKKDTEDHRCRCHCPVVPGAAPGSGG